MNSRKDKKHFIVSRETEERLQQFVEILKKWDKCKSLVGAKDIDKIWERHIEDSIHLAHYIKNKGARIVDVGSGNGFPGVVLAILLANPLMLVERSQKKCAFLNFVKAEMSLDFQVCCEDIEKVKQKFDVVTARAFASLEKILCLTRSIRDRHTLFLLSKGKHYKKEIMEAQKKFSFHYEEEETFCGGGVILSIRNVEELTPLYIKAGEKQT